jgi:SpoVK/Ycf46/Vps4 family AAA+-type ATPase
MGTQRKVRSSHVLVDISTTLLGSRTCQVMMAQTPFAKALTIVSAEPHLGGQQPASDFAKCFAAIPYPRLSERKRPPMHAVAYGALRNAQWPISRRACRVISGIRRVQPRRTFHRSVALYRLPDEPSSTEAEGDNISPEQGLDRKKPGIEAKLPRADDAVVRKGKEGKTGLVQARRNRSTQPEGLPPVTIPDWFFARNVKCFGDSSAVGSLAVFAEREVDPKDTEDVRRQQDELVGCGLASTADAKYSLHKDIYKEIHTTLKAELSLRPPRNTSQTIIRPHIVLQCPKDGGSYYLDSIVETVAAKLGVDLVQMDADDMAQILGPYVDNENLAWNRSRTSLLGYESQRVAGKLEEYGKYPSQEDSDGMEYDDENTGSGAYRSGKSLPSFSALSKELSKNLAPFLESKTRSWAGTSKSRSSDFRDEPLVKVELLRGTTPQSSQRIIKSSEDQWRELKIATVLDSLVAAADSKRALLTETEEQLRKVDKSGTVKDIIVQLKDYRELSGTNEGPDLLRSLQSVINKRWSEGRNIALVGTTSIEDCGLARPDIQHLQSDITSGETRTIFVPPDRREEQEVAFETDERTRVRRINIRHIEDMLFNLAEGAQHSPLTVNIEKNLDNATAYSAGLEDAVWTYPRVHRTALTILGLSDSSNSLDGLMFTKACELLASSDEAKFKWGVAELKREDDDVDIMLKDMNDSSKNVTKEKIKQIKKNCTVHEKRLLGGVIIPSDIHTTFKDVHAPKETVEALKTLTSLSLIRPDAFSYGVLATDKIPGLLLYGPPGTGKTLLAKAVAKESGATVLEVSGAEVNDMYVGEGEKNVKAIFTLAKKLSPCVVFIDEADAIFAQRSDMKRSGTHRELINQFLREWDGMNDLSAFIMVATNRPFDLDEAVLRRLPRRLLVDLPVEKDREAILKIHLKDEILDESVSLHSLAKKTPYYSGSDLKNISVAAAIACIREENEMAAKHTGDEIYVYPERRILSNQHFDKALDEISASISEDMSTLGAIRKFDTKFGDRKGRRKMGSGLGFGGTTFQEKDSEGGRVRKVKA